MKDEYLIENYNDNEKILYKVNDDVYFYQEKKFEKSLVHEYDKYITDYQDDNECILRIETANKELHDFLCKIIEEAELQGQNQVDKIYNGYSDIIRYHCGAVKLLSPKKDKNKNQQ